MLWGAVKWGQDRSIDRMRLRQPFNYKGTVWNMPKKNKRSQEAADWDKKDCAKGKKELF
jgi:hypothetical protein